MTHMYQVPTKLNPGVVQPRVPLEFPERVSNHEPLLGFDGPEALNA